MGGGGRDDGSWSRAFMASSGMPLGGQVRRTRSSTWHEAAGADLARHRFAELAHDRDPDVREVLARRDDCPMAVLATLAHDARVDVRVAVAANTAANHAILEQLARDRDPAVLKAVARNSSTHEALREVLARHRKADVRHVAQRVRDQVAATGRSDAASAEATLPPELRERAATAGSPVSDDPGSRARPPATLAPRPEVGGARGRAGDGAPPAPWRPATFFPDGPAPSAR